MSELKGNYGLGGTQDRWYQAAQEGAARERGNSTGPGFQELGLDVHT